MVDFLKSVEKSVKSVEKSVVITIDFSKNLQRIYKEFKESTKNLQRIYKEFTKIYKKSTKKTKES